jgi:hypothetical protein
MSKKVFVDIPAIPYKGHLNAAGRKLRRFKNHNSSSLAPVPPPAQISPHRTRIGIRLTALTRGTIGI